MRHVLDWGALALIVTMLYICVMKLVFYAIASTRAAVRDATKLRGSKS